MATELIGCPACGGADTSPADARGVHQCVFCGARYRINVPPTGAPMTVVMRESNNTSVVIAVVAAGVLLLLAGGGVAWYLFAAAPPPPPTPVSAIAPVAAPARAPVDADVATAAEGFVEPAVAPGDAPITLTATFEHHHTQQLTQSNKLLFGRVTNTSSAPIGKVKVIAVMLDKAGAELGTANGFSTLERIEPGASSPVKILIKDPPAYEQLKFELVPRSPMGFLRLAEGLRVEAGAPSRGLGRAWQVAGKVHNEGSTAAQFVRIEIVALNRDHKMIGVFTSYADKQQLEPGEDSRFNNAMMLLDEEPDHFEFSVVGRVAAPPGG